MAGTDSGPSLSETDKGPEFENKPIAAYRPELLRLGFEGVSKMPLNPHVKNRSRAQQKVAAAALELGQARTAESFIEKIENWRYWMAYADMAYYFAQAGDAQAAAALIEKVSPALKAAEERNKGLVVSSTPNERLDSLQDWRYESVLTRIAEVQLIFRGESRIDATEESVGTLNAALLNAKAALRQEPNETLEVLRAFADDPNFEVVHVGLVKMAEYAGTHYGELDLAAVLRDEVLPKIEKMPVFMRVDVLEKFAVVALRNNDAATAESLLAQMNGLISGLASRPQFHIPEAVKLIRLRHEAGQTDAARAELDALVSGYNKARERIVDIYRAELLCRMAEAYVYLGDPARALELYSLAVDEGQVNPNARPQADDLNEICCSMALAGADPTPVLMAKLQQMNDDLDQPW